MGIMSGRRHRKPKEKAADKGSKKEPSKPKPKPAKVEDGPKQQAES